MQNNYSKLPDISARVHAAVVADLPRIECARTPLDHKG